MAVQHSFEGAVGCGWVTAGLHVAKLSKGTLHIDWASTVRPLVAMATKNNRAITPILWYENCIFMSHKFFPLFFVLRKGEFLIMYWKRGLFEALMKNEQMSSEIIEAQKCWFVCPWGCSIQLHHAKIQYGVTDFAYVNEHHKAHNPSLDIYIIAGMAPQPLGAYKKRVEPFRRLSRFDISIV